MIDASLFGGTMHWVSLVAIVLDCAVILCALSLPLTTSPPVFCFFSSWNFVRKEKCTSVLSSALSEDDIHIYAENSGK